MFQYNKKSGNFYKEDNMIKKLVLLVLVIVCFAIFSSCHTTHGVGKDIESVGESIQKATD